MCEVHTELMGCFTSYISLIQPQNEASTGLIIAALYDNSEVVHLLLVSGADPNIQNTVSGVRIGNGTVECEKFHHMPVTLTTDQSITSCNRFTTMCTCMCTPDILKLPYSIGSSAEEGTGGMPPPKSQSCFTLCWHTFSIIGVGIVNNQPIILYCNR